MVDRYTAVNTREAKRGRVLLIDDDPVIADMYATALRRSGHDVLVAPGGRAGLSAAGESEFDVVLLDIKMPDMDGIAVLSRLRGDTRTKEWPVVMFTNSDDFALRVRAHHLGANDYVIKSMVMPSNLSDLIVRWTRASE